MTAIDVKNMVLEAGASAVGVARVHEVDEAEWRRFSAWLAEGRHGEMGYLANHGDVRRNPELLLPGAKSIIAAAFNYYNPIPLSEGELRWARYALGDDYHEEVRRRLRAVAERLEGEWRVCVDTAPLLERYWACEAGIGFVGKNNLLIVPGVGSWVVLGFILSTLELEADTPINIGCGECDRCVRACPGEALDDVGGMDARRCRSYQTIEYRGEDAVCSPGGRVYGCDICQEVCPFNAEAPATEIDAFKPRREILDLTLDDILGMEQGDFSRIFTHSAIKRTKLAGLQRNARYIGSVANSKPFDLSHLIAKGKA